MKLDAPLLLCCLFAYYSFWIFAFSFDLFNFLLKFENMFNPNVLTPQTHSHTNIFVVYSFQNMHLWNLMIKVPKLWFQGN